MDLKDKQIINQLQINGKISNIDLAEKVNLSPSPCLRRVKILEDKGIITGYTADIDQKAYGLPLTLFARIRLERHDIKTVENFEKHILSCEEVLECHLMSGSSDYQLKIITSDLDSYENFVRKNIHTIGGIASIDTSVAYGTIKKKIVYSLNSR